MNSLLFEILCKFDYDKTKQTIIKKLKNLGDVKHLLEAWSTKVVNREVKKINYKH